MSAQKIEFAPLDAKWTYSEQAFLPPPFGEFPHYVYVTGKEMYKGNLCSKILLNHFTSFHDPMYTYNQGDSVWYYSNFSNQFELLYNFAASAGSGWDIGGVGTPDGHGTMAIRVDSVSWMSVGGKTLKIQHISFPNIPFEWGKRIIAGIGNTGFLVPEYGLYEGGPDGLRCYADALCDIRFVSYPCDTIRGISSSRSPEKILEIKAWPNPTTGSLQIELPDPIEAQTVQVQFSDLAGRIVWSNNIMPADNTLRLDAGTLPEGVYFCKVIAAQWEYLPLKIVFTR